MKIKSRCTVHMHTIQYKMYTLYLTPVFCNVKKSFFAMGALKCSDVRVCTVVNKVFLIRIHLIRVSVSTLPMLPATEKTILAPAPDKKLTCSCGCCYYALVYFIIKNTDTVYAMWAFSIKRTVFFFAFHLYFFPSAGLSSSSSVLGQLATNAWYSGWDSLMRS